MLLNPVIHSYQPKEDDGEIKKQQVVNVLPYCPVTWESDELAQWIKDMGIFAIKV